MGVAVLFGAWLVYGGGALNFRKYATLVVGLLGWTLAWGLASPLSYAGNASAPSVQKEQWFELQFHGSKVGYLLSRDAQGTYEKAPARHAYRHSVITVRRQSQTIRMESTTDAWFGLDGEPLAFNHRRNEAGQKRSITGKRVGDQFLLQIAVGQGKQTRTIALDQKVYLASSLDALFYPRLAPGKVMRGRAILEEEGVVKDFKMEVTRSGKDGFWVEGELAGVKSRSQVSAEGKTLSIDVPLLGAKFVATTAKRAMDLQAPIDIFSAGLFSIDKPLPAGGKLKWLSLRLFRESGQSLSLPLDDRQKSLNKAKNTFRIRAEKAPQKPRGLKKPPDRIRRFLGETPYESLKDPSLVKTAREAAGGATDPWVVAKRINRFVYRHISSKTLSRAFSSAAEALASREGDCTEHAVLFSALAKIMGVPTRLVTGLVYVGGPKNVFGYHEWVEVWIAGRWVAMDPTFGQDLADPTHIKLAHGQSDPDGLREAGIVAASLIHDLKIEVVDYN